ncbi:MAG: alpha/beta fold hydrolase [Leeuwenhoekiella sp.]
MELYSNIDGLGKDFVILHGFFGMGDNWKTLSKEFIDAGYRVHLLDLRNHGRSPHSDDFSYDLMAGDVEAYCKTQNIGEMVLLGHSMGGKVAMQFAATYPERVTSLLIADIGPKYYPPHHGKILDALHELSQNPEALRSRGNADDFLGEIIKDWGTRQFLLKNLYRKKDKTLALRMNLPVLTEKIEEIGKGLPETAVIQVRTLFLRGENSSYILPEDHEVIHHIFPNSSIVTIKDAGHWLHAENPDDFFKEVIKFL